MTPWVVLPTYNEAENIEEVLRRIRKGAPDVHVLVVDDSSPDGTADLAERFGAELGEVDVVRRATQVRARERVSRTASASGWPRAPTS